MKKRALQGFGFALLMASPLWLTMERPPNYFSFGVSAALGGLLLLLAHLYFPSRRR